MLKSLRSASLATNLTSLTSLVIGILAFSSLPSFAELPKGNTFIPVGNSSEGTKDEVSYYIDKSSIKKKGNKLYYVTWSISKYEKPASSGKTQYAKSDNVADCQNWQVRQLNSSFIDRSGRIIDVITRDSKMQEPQPGSINYKIIDTICNSK